jgi:hypothetical protein
MNFCVYLSWRYAQENKFVKLFLGYFFISLAREHFILIKIEINFVLLIFSVPLPGVEDPTKFLPFIIKISQKYS